MRIRKKSILGKVSSSGEITAPWQSLYDFCSLHKDSNVIIRAEIMPKEPSEKTRNYFFGYLIPEMQTILHQEYGERFTKEQTYDWVRKQCPLFVEEERENGSWRKFLKEFEDMSQAEVNEAIEWLIQYTAENLYQILEYPQ